jgi:nucleotide-binding universal stress UspA family protein
MNASTSPGRVPTFVVAVDFSPASDRALEWATALAVHRGAALDLVHAVPLTEPTDGLFPIPPVIDEDYLGLARRRLDERAEALRGTVRSVAAHVALGSVVRTLRDAVEERRADLLVMGTRGLRGWEHILLGSTAQRILGTVACPVLVVHPQDPPPPARSLRAVAATDGSLDARIALAEAARLFDLDAGSALVHVFQRPAVYYSGAAVLAAEQVAAGARGAAEERLATEAAALRARGLEVRPVLREGYPADQIVEVAEVLAADLVVVGRRGHDAFTHLLLGSTAERVVQRAPAPVLVVPRRGAAVASQADEELALAGAVGHAAG